jgi:hypothetical protein
MLESQERYAPASLVKTIINYNNLLATIGLFTSGVLSRLLHFITLFILDFLRVWGLLWVYQIQHRICLVHLSTFWRTRMNDYTDSAFDVDCYVQSQMDEVMAEVEAGWYDTSTGIRPTGVYYSDRAEAIGVCYPGGPNWIGWDQLVRYI